MAPPKGTPREDIELGELIENWKDVFLHQLVKAKNSKGVMIQLRQKGVVLGTVQ